MSHSYIGVTFSETIDFNKFSKNDVIANILLLYDQDCDNSVMHTTNNLIDYHLNYCKHRTIRARQLGCLISVERRKALEG